MCNGLSVDLVAEVNLMLVVTKKCFSFPCEHILEQKSDQHTWNWITMPSDIS